MICELNSSNRSQGIKTKHCKYVSDMLNICKEEFDGDIWIFKDIIVFQTRWFSVVTTVWGWLLYILCMINFSQQGS